MKLHYTAYFLYITIFLTSCEAIKKAPLPLAKQLPSKYISNIHSQDSLLSPKDFFNDDNLVALIDTALKNNFDLMRAYQQVEFARANFMGAKGIFLPSLNPTLSYGLDKFGRNTMNGLGNFDTNLSPNIAAGQTIPDPTTDLFISGRSSWEIGLWGKYRNVKNQDLTDF